MRIPQIKDTWLDKAIISVSPGTAVKRRRARMILAISGGYDGGRSDKRGLTTYNPIGGSADADINFDLPTLRNRTRDLNRNNPIGAGAIHTNVTNVIGTGLHLNSRIDRNLLGLSPEVAQEFEQGIERRFRIFNKECDIERNQTFSEIQALVFRSMLESGDAVVLMPFLRHTGEAYGLKLQVVEGDRLCNPNMAMDTANISGGVELDAYGAPVRYHIMNVHPGDIKLGGQVRKWQAYDAFSPQGRRQVLHIFRKERPGQHRGVPYLAPVIEILKQLGRYSEGEVMRAVIQGMFTVFTHTETGQGMDIGMPDTGGSTNNKAEEIKMGYGAVIDMGTNDKIDFANPSSPNTAFDPFVQAILRQIGMALELPYEVLIKSFTASFSAARASINDAFCTFLVRRALLKNQLCEPVFEAFMTEDIARGYSYAPGFNSDPMIKAAYLGADWIGSAMRQINPVYEVEAAKGRVELKLSTRSEECQALTGTDWESKLPQIERESKMFAPPPANLPQAQSQPGKPAETPQDPNQNQDEKGDVENQ